MVHPDASSPWEQVPHRPVGCAVARASLGRARVASQRMTSVDDQTRRYTVLELLGEGGFGKVYRARMDGPDGFAKDVAIKLLHDDDFPESIRRRFRDEARILGLLRDRAIITVDPPTRLGGQWAIVMEFVDGVSADWLARRLTIPPTVVLELVQEVARALDVAWRQEGPDGQPLRLLHRDIKPGNLQVTPNGAVKVLDFGIARADFGKREAKTNRHVGGTFGYIAPERIEGIDGPEGDVYALGVVLHELVTGSRPGAGRCQTMDLESLQASSGERTVLGVIPDEVSPVVALAGVMRSRE